jgi:superfamily I DNA and/or RNA helicase
LFVNVKGREFYEKGGTSYANMDEIKVVLDYVRKLTQNATLKNPVEIGIISPYKHQTRLLQQRIKNLKDANLADITADSVERFQGSERDIIITTATRTTKLGFVGCKLVSFLHVSKSGHGV